MTAISKQASSSEALRNPGTPLDLAVIRSQQVNRSAAERRVAKLTKGRSLKQDWQTAWLLRALSCLDLTTLAGDDTPERVMRLCAKARQPLRPDIVQALDIESWNLTVGAVCVYANMIPTALEALKGSNIPVAAVSTGFPAGQVSLKHKLSQIEEAVAAGAQEIDIVISRQHALRGDWQALYDEVKAFRKACGPSHMKTILATGELADLRQVAQASQVCMMAGADFIKTSTGKEKVNATLVVSLVMLRAIRAYHQRTGLPGGLQARRRHPKSQGSPAVS
jgi:deoxyribose-phosphate aldolase